MKSRTLQCECGKTFSTTAPNRRKCYSCSPARPIAIVLPDGTLDTPVIPDPGLPPPVTESPPAGDDRPWEPGAIYRAVESQLSALGAVDTVDGSIALALARELDGVDITGASRTSMSKQLSTMIEEIKLRIPPEPDEVDELQDRVRRLRGS